MLKKIFAGASGLALALSLAGCSKEESPLATETAMQPVSALVTSPFAWQFTESFSDTEKVALTRQIPFEGLRDIMILAVRRGSRLVTMTYLEDEEILDPASPAFGPSNCIGTPAIANTGSTAQTNNIVILTKLASGSLQLGKRDASAASGWKVLATFGSGLATGNFGNPAMAYNPVAKKLEVAYREGSRIRHWSGAITSTGAFTFKDNGLIPGTGGTGTQVISALGLAVKADGKLVVAARRAEKNLRFWSTTNSAPPYAWQTGAAFGAVEESNQAPSLAAHGDGTVQVVVVGKKNGTTPELLQYQISGSSVAFLSVIKGFDHNGAVTSTGHSHPSVAAMDSKSLVTVTGYKTGSIIGVGIR